MTSILSHALKYLFLIDHDCNLKSKLIAAIESSQEWMLFLQGVDDQRQGSQPHRFIAKSVNGPQDLSSDSL